jgi:hypothetical protein
MNHSEIYQDGAFVDPFLASLTGLIRCRADMHEAILTGFVCPFCDYHGRHIDALRAHVREHSDSAKRFLKVLDRTHV